MDEERGVKENLKAKREGNVPAPGHLGSPSPSLPNGGKRKLLPGREAMTSRANEPCGVRGAGCGAFPPPSSGNRTPEPLLLTHRAQTPAPQRRQAVARPRSLSPSRCQQTQPGPRAPAQPHVHSRPLLTPLIPLSG